MNTDRPSPTLLQTVQRYAAHNDAIAQRYPTADADEAPPATRASRELVSLAHHVIAASNAGPVESDAVRAFAQTVLAFLAATS